MQTKSDQKQDGGPAFPHGVRVEEYDSYVGSYDERRVVREGYADGMSLRDWFAGQALNALALVAADRGDLGGWPSVARESYAMADAMLAAREGK